MAGTYGSIVPPTKPPKIIGLCGRAGSGKDTFADELLRYLPADSFAFADPMKEFARSLFAFTDEQLWGPSSSRNAVDYRFSVRPRSLLKRLIFAVVAAFYSVVFHVSGVQFAVNGGTPATPKWLGQESFDVQLARYIVSQKYLKVANRWLEEIGFRDDSYAREKLDTWFAGVLAQEHITPRYVLQTLGTEFGRAVKDTLWVDLGLQRAQRAVDGGRFAVIKDVRFSNEAQRIRDVGGDVIRITRPEADAAPALHASEQEMDSAEMHKLYTALCINDGSLADFLEKARREAWGQQGL